MRKWTTWTQHDNFPQHNRHEQIFSNIIPSQCLTIFSHFQQFIYTSIRQQYKARRSFMRYLCPLLMLIALTGFCFVVVNVYALFEVNSSEHLGLIMVKLVTCTILSDIHIQASPRELIFPFGQDLPSIAKGILFLSNFECLVQVSAGCESWGSAKTWTNRSVPQPLIYSALVYSGRTEILGAYR